MVVMKKKNAPAAPKPTSTPVSTTSSVPPTPKVEEPIKTPVIYYIYHFISRLHLLQLLHQVHQVFQVHQLHQGHQVFLVHLLVL